MYQTDFDVFRGLMADVCIAHDKPVMDDRIRVYWEALKPYPLAKVRFALRSAIGRKKFPTPKDLMPDEAPEADGKITSRNIPEELNDFVMKNYKLTPTQIRSPWTYVGRCFDAMSLDKDKGMIPNHGVEFTGVIIPADGDAPSFRVTCADMRF